MELRFRIPSNAKVTQTPPGKFVKDNSLYVLDQNDNLLFAFKPPAKSWSWKITPSEVMSFGYKDVVITNNPEEMVLVVSSQEV